LALLNEFQRIQHGVIHLREDFAGCRMPTGPCRILANSARCARFFHRLWTLHVSYQRGIYLSTVPGVDSFNVE
jgi:hypothetical protein